MSPFDLHRQRVKARMATRQVMWKYRVREWWREDPVRQARPADRLTGRDVAAFAIGFFVIIILAPIVLGGPQ